MTTGENILNTVSIIAGHAGSGKSTYAHKVATENWAAYVDKDTLLKGVVEQWCEEAGIPGNDRDSTTYWDEVRPQEYAALEEAILDLIKDGVSHIVVDAPFIKEIMSADGLDPLRENVQRDGYHLHTTWVHCDSDQLRERIAKRGSPRDIWKLENWDEWAVGLVEPPSSHYDIRYDNS